VGEAEATGLSVPAHQETMADTTATVIDPVHALMRPDTDAMPCIATSLCHKKSSMHKDARSVSGLHFQKGRLATIRFTRASVPQSLLGYILMGCKLSQRHLPTKKS
jgi:hypothetical protein